MRTKTIASVITVLLLVITVFTSRGQSFLSKYPELTKDNLSDFFADWKAYSDSVAQAVVINDSVLNRIVNDNYAALVERESNITDEKILPEYYVIPQYIRVNRYNADIDTVDLEWSWGFPSGYRLEKLPFHTDTITPQLPHRGLYLSDEIYEPLSRFVGGLKLDDGDNYSEIIKENVRLLQEYIPVDYGHWGGYWWFTSFPQIGRINYADNLIGVSRRISWCRGDEVLYVKENNKFVRKEGTCGHWIE